jgi:N-acetylglucosamine kinase
MSNVYHDYSGETLDAKGILKLWHEKHTAAVRTVDAFVHLVSNELALVVNVIDPQIIPVGGGLSNNAELIALIDRETRRKSLGQLSRSLVVPGTGQINGCLLGASFL